MANNSNGENVVVRGLEGVVAAETSISYVDGIHGRLLYQGYDIRDLAENRPIRPTSHYIGEMSLPFLPIEKCAA